ncbi:hypothetical protein GE061_009666 [Apolygus lucorum]|uniref:Carboxylic ester hydrolase n=1 Tax=Apolygus lucorum TaxID=248454 RepID=A0A8S9Y2X8_APOLU|nr:hypothetical protein GE061_009666 [Apolygus lucorum]
MPRRTISTRRRPADPDDEEGSVTDNRHDDVSLRINAVESDVGAIGNQVALQLNYSVVILSIDITSSEGMWSMCVLAAVLQGCQSQNLDNPVIDTLQGRAMGWERLSRDGRVYQAWSSIPYAQPPLGELRFKPSKLAEKWTGTLNATVDPPMCLQASENDDGVVGSEDCLHVNVYRPKNFGGAQALPVLFWIFGGFFEIKGCGPHEVADYLMDHDVIFVAFNYRTNFFGWLSLGDKIFPGNFGLKDMLTALRWVKKNIASFGGDPNSVTVFGQSSGAMNAQQLLLSPLVEKENLITRVVSDSGTINHVCSLPRPDFVVKKSLEIIEAVGCEVNVSSEEIRKCLQAVDGETIMLAYINIPKNRFRPTLAPVIEPEDAEDIVIPYDLSLRKSSKPWITSTANGEYNLYLQDEFTSDYSWNEKSRNNVTGYLETLIETSQYSPDSSLKIEESARLLQHYYFKTMDPMENFTRNVAMVESDLMFIYPFLYNIEKQKDSDAPIWAFRNEYKGEFTGREDTGEVFCVDDVAGHAETRFYYLNLRSTLRYASPKQTPEDEAVSRRLVKYLVNFAYYGNPTPPGSPFIWEQYKGKEMMRITKNGDFMADDDYVGDLMKILPLWNRVLGWK